MTMNYEFRLLYIYLVCESWLPKQCGMTEWSSHDKLKRNMIYNLEPSTELSFKLISIKTKIIMCRLAVGRGSLGPLGQSTKRGL